MLLKNQIQLYVKSTEACNLHCAHCYNKVGDEESTLDLVKFEKFIASMTEYVSKFEEDVYLDLILHGGEPMLMGVPFLREIVRIVKQYLSFTDIRVSVQTNLVTNFGDEFLTFVKEVTDNHIGTSYSPGLRFIGEEEHLEKVWLENVHIAQKAGCKVYPVLSVSREYVENSDPKDLVKYLVDNEFIGYHVEPLTMNGSAARYWEKLTTPPKEFDAWKAKFTKIFIEERAWKTVKLNEIVRRAKTFFDGAYTGCSGRDCMLKVITVNSDGTVGTCPNNSKIKVISTMDEPFENFINSDMRRDLILNERQRRQECLECKYFQYCNGGCVMKSDGCYEGSAFFEVLETKLKEDEDFREEVKAYERAFRYCSEPKRVKQLISS